MRVVQIPFIAVHVVLPCIALVVVPIISMREPSRQHLIVVRTVEEPASQPACMHLSSDLWALECPTADAMAVTLCPESYAVVMHWLNFEHTTTFCLDSGHLELRLHLDQSCTKLVVHAICLSVT